MLIHSIPQSPLGPSRLATPAARPEWRVNRTKGALPFLVCDLRKGE
jgi:hypothetical protein